MGDSRQSESGSKDNEDKAREEINSLLNMIKSKCSNMSAEDNGAFQKLMNKLEDSISKVNYNAST